MELVEELNLNIISILPFWKEVEANRFLIPTVAFIRRFTFQKASCSSFHPP